VICFVAVNDPLKDLGISTPTTLSASRTGSLKGKNQEDVRKSLPASPIGMMGGMGGTAMNSMRSSANYSPGFR
jgi:hypothetical protein